MGNREYGSGTVYQRASDGRWIGAFNAGWTAKGTPHRIQVSAKTKTEATRRLRDKRRQYLDGDNTTSTRITVKTWAEQWLPLHQARVRPSTYATDAGAIRKWITPTIGHRHLADLTPGDIRAVDRAIRDAGRSSTTARHAVGVLQRLCKAARAEGHTVPERLQLVPLPARAVNDRTAIPLADARAFLHSVMGRPDTARWVAALLQGLRQGEALGLTWDAVDLDGGTLDVSWQLQRLPYLDKPTGTFRVPDGFEVRHLHRAYHLTRPKTARGQRVVPLTPWLEAALREHRHTATPNPWGLLWPMVDDRNGKQVVVPANGKRDRETWNQLQAAAGIAHPAGRPYLLHEARHSCATMLQSAGVDESTILAIMGHSSMLVTRGYVHVSQESARIALGRVAAQLGIGE